MHDCWTLTHIYDCDCSCALLRSLSTGRDESRLTSASEAGKLAYRVGERVFSLLDLRALSLDSGG